MSKHFLSIAAFYKNEAHILKEWLDHYLAEGVDHFYMIDNNSTDNHKQVLYPYWKRGLISPFWVPNRYAQIMAYNQFVLPRKNDSEWILVCDLDEFVYARMGTMAEWVRKSFGTGLINSVRIPWVNFGSSGLIRQPRSVMGSFLNRRSYDPEKIVWTKSIVRTRNLVRLDVHTHALDGWYCSDGCLNRVSYQHQSPLSEEYIKNSGILLNHYQTQSYEWMKIKAARGSAARQENDETRSEKHLRDLDWNEVLDETLARKRGLIP